VEVGERVQGKRGKVGMIRVVKTDSFLGIGKGKRGRRTEGGLSGFGRVNEEEINKYCLTNCKGRAGLWRIGFIMGVEPEELCNRGGRKVEKGLNIKKSL